MMLSSCADSNKSFKPSDSQLLPVLSGGNNRSYSMGYMKIKGCSAYQPEHRAWLSVGTQHIGRCSNKGVSGEKREERKQMGLRSGESAGGSRGSDLCLSVPTLCFI